MMVWYILYDVFMYALILCLVYVLIYALVYDLVYVLVYIFGNVSICTHVYGCKYHNELCYEAPLCDMGVMSF